VPPSVDENDSSQNMAYINTGIMLSEDSYLPELAALLQYKGMALARYRALIQRSL
jgi:hypothetical protein